MSPTTPRSTAVTRRSLVLLAALAVTVALLPLGTPAGAQETGADDPVEVTILHDTHFHGSFGPDEPADPTDVAVARFAGQNRADTARLIAAEAFPDADTAIIASGERFPDALAGSYLAGALEAPVLLVARNTALPETLAALDELPNVTRLIVLGGDGVISPQVRAALATEGRTVDEDDRFFGPTRFETAAEIAFAVDEIGTWDEQTTAIVASGENYPDALVAGTLAYSEGFPILLTERNRLHPAAAEALTELDIERVIIAGGTGAVTAGVQSAIEELDITVDRTFGVDRWGTGLAFAELAVEEFGYSLDEINIAGAQGERGFADALAIAPRAGRNGNPLILTNGRDPVPVAPVAEFLVDNACEILSLVVAGGTAAVTDVHAAAHVEAANACEPTFEVALSWENEVNPTAVGPVSLEDHTQFGWGQPGAEGVAALFLEEEDGEHFFGLAVEGLESAPLAIAGSPAHIHEGAINENGPVVVVLGSMDDFDYDEETGLLFGAGETVVNDAQVPAGVDIFAEIVANPQNYYVNVHTEGFPTGAVRGQLPDGGQDLLPDGIVPQPAEEEPDTDPVVTVEATGGAGEMTVTGTATATEGRTIAGVVYNLQDEDGVLVSDEDVPVTVDDEGDFEIVITDLDPGTYTIFVTASDNTGAFTVEEATATVTAVTTPPPTVTAQGFYEGVITAFGDDYIDLRLVRDVDPYVIGDMVRVVPGVPDDEQHIYYVVEVDEETGDRSDIEVDRAAFQAALANDLFLGLFIEINEDNWRYYLAPVLPSEEGEDEDPIVQPAP
jgi:putative cell wall-binding protein